MSAIDYDLSGGRPEFESRRRQTDYDDTKSVISETTTATATQLQSRACTFFISTDSDASIMCRPSYLQWKFLRVNEIELELRSIS